MTSSATLKKTAFALLCLHSSFGFAIPLVVKVEPDTKPVSFQIPYSLGTHSGASKTLTGKVDFDPTKPDFRGGRFTVPIASLTTGSDKQDCHLREAMGIDYSKSQYPDSHACEDNQLPAQGPDAVVFPEIAFHWKSSKIQSGQPPLEKGKPITVEAVGNWEMHGQTQATTVELSITLESAEPLTLRVRGRFPFSLKDYGIQVKPFLFVKVKDTATAEVDFLLQK